MGVSKRRHEPIVTCLVKLYRLVIVVAKAMISKRGPVLSRYISCRISEVTFYQ